MVVEAVVGGYGNDSWHDLLLHVPDNDKGKLADCQRPSLTLTVRAAVPHVRARADRDLQLAPGE